MFYTYIHTRASDNMPFYVGKGNGRRSHSREGRNPYWHHTVAKHGIKIDIAAKWSSEKEAFSHEKFLIQCFTDMGFPMVNMTTGGEGGSHTAETLAKLSKLAKGRKRPPRSPEWSKRIGDALRNRKISDDVKEHLRIVNTGRKHSEVTRTKMSISARSGISDKHKTRNQTGALNHLSKKITCVETNMKFDSAADAARYLREIGKHKAAKSGISAACRGVTHTAYGFHWKFADTSVATPKGRGDTIGLEINRE
jgi:hypothetical protein